MIISRQQALLLLGFPLLVMIVFYFVPLLLLLQAAFLGPDDELTLANIERVFLDAYYWSVLAYTIRIAALSTLATLLLGYPLAYYMTITLKSRLMRRVCLVVLITPLFTSSIVRAFSWLVLLGRNGLVNDTLHALAIIERPVAWLGSEASIIIGMSYVMLPFMVLSISSSLQALDPSLREASRDLGGGPLSTFLRVTLPLTVPGILGGSLIVFTLSVSSYVTPRVMSGGRSSVTSMLIYDAFMQNFQPGVGAALAIMLLVATTLLIVIYSTALGRRAKAGGAV